jgi:hypothetical protein
MMSHTLPHANISWGLIAALLLVVALRLPYIDRPFNDEDVAQIAYSASRAVEGQLLYRDTVDYKPPLALTLFAATFRLFGREMAAVNAVALLWALGATALVFLLTQTLFGRTAAVGAALFYAVFANSDTVNGTSPSYDFWMLPFMVAAVYCLGQALQPQKDKAGRWLLASGICSGLATTSKQHALFNFVALLNYLVLVACWDRAQRKALPQRLLLLGLGFIGAWLPFILYFWSQGGLSAFWDSLSPRHNISYMGARTSADALSAARGQLIRQMSRDTMLWVFALAGLVSLIVGKRKQGRPSQCVNDALLMGLWAFWSFVGVSVTKRFYDHYFLQMMPVFSVLAGYVWGLCFQGLGFRVGWRWALGAVIVLGFLWSGRQSFRAREMLRRTHALLTGKPSRDGDGAKQVGDYIRARSTPADRLYVWGWKPEIYYFADRQAPTKWWEFGIESGRWLQIEQEFERHKPQFIVVVNGAPGGPPEFRDYVRRNFVPDTRIAGFEILRRRPRLARGER